MRILIVEDNHRLSHELRQSLMYEGYAVDLAYDGDAGLAFAESAPYDAMILDVLLPIQDGLEVCHTLRQHGCTIPILMLTARDALDDRGGVPLAENDQVALVDQPLAQEIELRALTRPIYAFDDDQSARQAVRSGEHLRRRQRRYRVGNGRRRRAQPVAHVSRLATSPRPT